MCCITALFCDEEDVVLQYHSKKSASVHRHEYCLHLWRLVEQERPTPPQELVGYKRPGHPEAWPCGQGRATTHGVAKKAARGSRWLASWCIPGTQYIPPVRVDASPSTSSQHSRG